MPSTPAPHDAAVRPTLLVVDDEAMTLRATARMLGKQGYEVLTASDGEAALELLRTERVDACLLDMVLPGPDGVSVMRAIQDYDPSISCIIFTGNADPGVAYEALSAGALDYFEKPIVDMARFNGVLRRAVSRRQEPDVANRPVERDSRGELKNRLIGHSEAMQRLRWHVERLAPRNASVLLLGPIGAGKNRVASALHEASGRQGEYIHVNCGNLDSQLVRSELFGHERGAFTGAERTHKGAFERAEHGTVFLDEIGEVPIEMQSRLLRVLEEGHYTRVGGSEQLKLSARVVAATNRDLDAEVAKGRFRQDLLNRLRIKLQIPALNDRRGDIPQLVYYFMEQINAQEGLEIRRVPRPILQRLAAHDWTDNNVRGLWNVLLETAIYSCGDALELSALPDEVARGGATLDSPVDRPQGAQLGSARDTLPERFREMAYNDFKAAVLHEYVSLYVSYRLAEAGGNITRAAERAEMQRPNFKRLMKRFGVSVPKGD